MEQVMKKRSIYSIIAALLVVGVTTLSCLLYIDRMQFGNRLQGKYQKDLYDLIGNIQNLETDLSKIGVSASNEQCALLFGDIWRQAGSAADRVNSLPITHAAISQTSKFLNQVSDFSYTLVKNIGNGNTLTSGEWDNIKSLRNNAAYLRNELSLLQTEMEDGGFKWSEIRYEGGKLLGRAQTNVTDERFASIDKEMEKRPTLIYDGPFSENVLNITPKVSSEPQIGLNDAKEKVMDIIGRSRIAEIGTYSSKGEGRIAVYPFYVILKGSDKSNAISIDISKNGGHVVYMINPRPVGNASIDNKKAIDIGLRFLADNGFKNMIPTFSQGTDNTLVVNYVYVDDSSGSNVVIYPDQIKVKVALDNGDVIGVEAEKYLMAHHKRALHKAKLSASEARAKASKNIKITNTRLAVIPMLSQREVFCYEFVGTYDGTTYIVYINAENGNEENILQIIDTPGGQLAV
jgi:spore germination protein